MELLRILIPLGAVGCFVWGAVQCARRTLFPQRNPAFGRRGLPGGLWRPALLCLLAGAAVQLVLVGTSWREGSFVTLGQALDARFYGNTDARHYLDLARYGYGAGEAFPEQYLMIVFFPLFPWLLRLLNPADYLGVMTSGVPIKEKKHYLAEYKKYVAETIVYDHEYHIVFSIMRDITSEEERQSERSELCNKTVAITNEVIEKQMRVVQEIASLLGETTAETKIALTQLKDALQK